MKKKKNYTGPLNGFDSNQFKCTFHTINSPLIKIDDGMKKKTLNICKETKGIQLRVLNFASTTSLTITKITIS